MSLDDNVRLFSGISPLPMDPDIMLQAAQRAQFNHVMVIGWQTDGEFFFSSSVASGPEVLWLLEVARKRLLEKGGA